MSLLIAGGLDYLTFEGPFQPKLFYDSVNTTHTEIFHAGIALKSGMDVNILFEFFTVFTEVALY